MTPSRVILGCALFLASLAAESKTICVNAAATGGNNGGCWTDAYVSLQTALGAAASGDEIWVEAATYKPTGTTDRTISFALKNGVGVYGGFAGGETMRSQRNPAINITILSGDIGAVGNSSDNSYHVVTSDSSVTGTGVLDGFTITGGNANGGGANQDRGGGMWINSGSPTVSHCIFDSNSASEKGGGLRVTSASPLIDGCVFTSNSGGAGGGGLGGGSGSVFTVKNTVFRGNSTASTGGGGLETGDLDTVINCVFQNNSGNGLLFIVGGTVINSTFTGNSSYGAAFDQDGTVANSILWADAIDEVFVGFGTIGVTYSDVGGSGFSGTGDIGADPLFVNTGAFDLRLGSGSPAIDAGNNAAVPGGITTDIDGLPRFFDDPAVPDTGAGTPPIVDMGAHERVPFSVSAPSPSPQTVCAGVSVTFTVTASGQGPFTYQWRHDGSNLSNGGSISGAKSTTVTINPTVAGDSGNYDVIVKDSLGQMLTSTTGSLTVNAIPSAPTAGNNGPICAGQTLQLTASTVAGGTYSWTGPNGFLSAQQNPTIASAMAAASGTYSVTVTVSGCTSLPAMTTATISVCTAQPAALAVDSAGNGVLEPGETVIVDPSWMNTTGSSIALTGIATSFTGPAGATYSLPDASANYGTIGAGATASCSSATGDCYTVSVSNPASRPQLHWDASLSESVSSGDAKTWKIHVGGSFADVAKSSPFYRFVETLLHDAVTGGCGSGNFCPGANVSRAQMAVFLLVSKQGAGYTPPPCTSPIFADVPCSSGFAAWINELFNRGVTAGCGGGNYCPTADVTRAQMAVFLLRTLEGISYTPPACVTPTFADVPCSSGFAPWVDELAARGITAGCGGGNYCPNNPVTRGQMAVFLTTTFGLQLYGP